MKQGCPAIQYNTKVPDYSCGKEQGHSGGHVDPARPYGMRGAKAARKRKVK
jgi:hypothetical protein